MKLALFLFIYLFSTSLEAQLLKSVFKEDEFSGTIYQNYRDNDGFIWISTDQGVFRWDSKNLEQFTTKDGLTSNEVFKCYQDSKKKVWMTFYNGDICYYYQGKIYNKNNDNRLASLPKIACSDIVEVKKLVEIKV